MELRSFSFLKGARCTGDSCPPENSRAIATFNISVLFRQNASWQGSIVWVEKAAESQFRSVFELITQIDSGKCEEQ